MGDGYFYTLSAIAQSFAAIVGLNGIFVVYRLQTITNLHRELIQQARQLWVREQCPSGAGMTFEQYKTEVGRFDNDYIIHWLKEPNGKCDIVQQKKEIDNEYIINEKLENNIYYWFKRTLIINTAVIAASLLLLPWRKYFYEALQNIIIGIMLILCCISLIITIHAVLITIGVHGLKFFTFIKRKQ